jgi:hypothetical protein
MITGVQIARCIQPHCILLNEKKKESKITYIILVRVGLVIENNSGHCSDGRKGEKDLYLGSLLKPFFFILSTPILAWGIEVL